MSITGSQLHVHVQVNERVRYLNHYFSTYCYRPFTIIAISMLNYLEMA